jgi:hypothetical protein
MLLRGSIAAPHFSNRATYWLRRGEICALQFFDLNFDRGLIHVRNTKNGKDRIIPMNRIVRQLLENQKVLRAQPRKNRDGTLKVPSTYVFPSPRTDERLVEIKYSFARAVKEAKFTDLRFHDLRHTAATRMGDAGADAFTLAAIFGWSDIRMAMRYTHAMEDAKRRAVEAIAQRSPTEVVQSTRAGEDACGPSKERSLFREVASNYMKAHVKNDMKAVVGFYVTPASQDTNGERFARRNFLKALVAEGGIEPPTLGL